jgi:hypothetical protein
LGGGESMFQQVDVISHAFAYTPGALGNYFRIGP